MGNVLEKLLNFSTKKVELFGAQYKAFGILALINFPAAYFILHNAMHQDESMKLRILAAILSIPLAFHDYLPSKAQKYLPLYWHGVLLYSFPFFCTYQLLKNNVSLGWLSNMSLGLFLFILLVDWAMFCIIVVLGVGIGVAVYTFIHGFSDFYIQSSTNDLYLACNQYSFIIIVGIFFSRHQEIIKLRERLRLKEELQSMENLAAAIAHELRTPLASLAMVGESLKKYLPVIERWRPKESDQESSKALELFSSAPERINATTRNAFIVIDMILMNLKRKPISHTYTEYYISNCIELMLNEYPLDAKQKELIHWDQRTDFAFYGHELYVKHILFNLLKNALYYSRAANKGEIYIWLEKGDKFNYLHFKDTSQGIPFSILPHIFENFYSRTVRGTGVGLAFCKSTMISFGGDITCESIEGEYTTFKLAFPVSAQGN